MAELNEGPQIKAKALSRPLITEALPQQATPKIRPSSWDRYHHHENGVPYESWYHRVTENWQLADPVLGVEFRRQQQVQQQQQEQQQ